METNKFQKGRILYITELTCVDVDTGEEICGVRSWIKENYTIINKQKEEVYNYLTKTTKELWLLKKKIKQITLNL